MAESSNQSQERHRLKKEKLSSPSPLASPHPLCLPRRYNARNETKRARGENEEAIKNRQNACRCSPTALYRSLTIPRFAQEGEALQKPSPHFCIPITIHPSC